MNYAIQTKGKFGQNRFNSYTDHHHLLDYLVSYKVDALLCCCLFIVLCNFSNLIFNLFIFLPSHRDQCGNVFWTQVSKILRKKIYNRPIAITIILTSFNSFIITLLFPQTLATDPPELKRK